MSEQKYSWAIDKLIENLLSIKVWFLLTVLAVSSIALFKDKMTGDVWAAINGGLTTSVFALREVFKINKVNSSDDSTNLVP